MIWIPSFLALQKNRKDSMNKILCPNSTCGEQLFPEVDGWDDSVYTETCPFCFGEFFYNVIDGIAYPWEPPEKDG